jgi:hypothetical protein
LSTDDTAYLGLATKFFEHYAYIGAALKHMGGRNFELWSQRDGFFYDVLCYPDGTYHKFRVRSLVGLIPLFAAEVLDDEWMAQFPDFYANFQWFLRNRSSTAGHCVTTLVRDQKKTHVLALLDSEQLCRVLTRVWDPMEFRGAYGLRSLSKFHQEHPFQYAGQEVRFEPAESRGYMKGGNSNWRGPVWFPTTFLMIESLVKLSQAYGATLTIPSALSGEPTVTLEEMAHGFADRLIALFVRDASGQRPAHGGDLQFQHDPHWRDLILFYEYFHGDTGAGLGASHQTGWTGLVATLLDEWRQ